MSENEKQDKPEPTDLSYKTLLLIAMNLTGCMAVELAAARDALKASRAISRALGSGLTRDLNSLEDVQRRVEVLLMNTAEVYGALERLGYKDQNVHKVAGTAAGNLSSLYLALTDSKNAELQK